MPSSTAADVYSFGVVLFEIATCEAPSGRDMRRLRCAEHTSSGPLSFAQQAAACVQQCAHIVLACTTVPRCPVAAGHGQNSCKTATCMTCPQVLMQWRQQLVRQGWLSTAVTVLLAARYAVGC